MAAIINLSFVKEQYGGDDDFLKKLLAMYLDYTPKLISEIENQIEMKDIMAAKAATHKVKTDILMLGISSCQDFFSLMSSQNADHVDFEKTKIAFSDFKNTVTAGLAELKTELQKM